VIPYRREKLSSQIIKDISAILHTQMKDPRLGLVSVTRVTLTPDLSEAKVFVSVLGADKEKKLTMSALRHARGFVQRELSHRLAIRQCPAIEFVRDDSIEKTIKLTSKIDKLTKEREARVRGDASAGQAPERGEVAREEE